jgi:glycosyltransferase involved in cell wall biosynthesis
MALEAPIVASDLPSIREILTDGVSASLVDPSHVGPFARAMLDVLADSRGAKDRAREARTRFMDAYTIDHISKEMLSFYQRSLVAR